MTYKFFNANPTGNKTSDCVVRALCVATGKNWDDVYVKLCEIGMNLKEMPNSDEVWKTYLSGISTYKSCKAVKGKKRTTPESFAEANKEGVFVLRLAGHIVAVKDGQYWDTWNCGNKCVYGYYEIH